MNQPSQRPTLITVICVIVFLTIVFGAFSIPILYGTLISLYGDWYGPLWIVTLLLTLVSLAGFWQMKRWGVYTYVGLFVIGSAVGLIMDIPLTAVDTIVPLAISIIGILNLKRMT